MKLVHLLQVSARQRKPDESHRDANDKAWSPMKILKEPCFICAKICEKYEDDGKDMVNVDREVDEKCEMIDDAAKMVIEKAEEVARTLEKSRERHHNVVEVYDTVECDINLAVQELKAVVGAIATATCAPSYG